jgi:hypothetical protein
MKSRVLPSIVCLLLIVAGSISTGGEGSRSDWAVKGSWTDSCCCKVACPCLFGTGPTEGYCEGASLLEIEAGHHGDVKLDGTAVVATYRVGKWARIHVSDSASPEQIEAIAAIIPKAMPFLGKGSVGKAEAVPLVVERSGDTIKFSVPETTVELALMEGADGGPIKLENLPAKGTPFPQFHDHTQYKSIRLAHESDAASFSWSGRNGFASKVDLAGAVNDHRE